MIILVWDMSLGWRHRPPRGNGSLPIENTHTHRSHDHREHRCDGEGPDELKYLHADKEAEDEHASPAVQHLQRYKGLGSDQAEVYELTPPAAQHLR